MKQWLPVSAQVLVADLPFNDEDFIDNPSIIGVLLPSLEEIPSEFITGWHHSDNFWGGVVKQWFYRGLDKSKFCPKPHINADSAWLHLGCCLHSFEPGHNHKMGGVAWLMSQWFDKCL